MSEAPSDPPERPSPDLQASPDTAEVPERIGPYRILQLIGEGGMGVVYKAQQSGAVSRRVALKVLRPGVATKEVVARFEAERQALAVMDHPNIAKVFDAGVTDDSQPYFVMELVRGSPLTEYCDVFKLSTRQRLELFVLVCRAVQHAHQKGVIHRDLKPSNVLVSQRDDRPVPKIIDFGIAKAVSGPLTARTLVTEWGRALGTPAYMSPEQAGMSGLDIDTRTDVYSLGVMLYELLVGRLPIDPVGLGRQEFLAQLVMGEKDPPRPSVQLTSMGDQQRAIAEFRHTDPRALVRELRGDLDWIVMKAVEKDRSRRYETVNGLALDIERYLNHEPVIAAPPSALYRMVKFVRRNKTGVAATVAVLVALAIGAVAMVEGRIRAGEAEAAMAREAEAAQQIEEFLTSIFFVSDPEAFPEGPASARELLDRGTAQIVSRLQNQPVVQARLMGVMGRVYTNLGLFDEALPLLGRSREIREAELGPDHLDVAESLQRLAWLFIEKGDFSEAEPLLERTIAIREQHLGSDHEAVADGRAQLGVNYMQQGRYAEAEPLLLQALAIQEQKLDSIAPPIATTVTNLGVLYWNLSRLTEAERFLERSLAIMERTLAPGHPRLGTSLNNLGVLYFTQGKYEEAEQAYERARAIWEGVLEPNHPDIARALNNLAEVYWVQGRYSDAEDYFQRSLAIKEAALSSDHPDIATSLHGLANVYRDQSRYAEAEPLYQRALTIREVAQQSKVAETLTEYAEMLRRAGRPDEAAELETRAEAIGAGGG